MRAAVLSSPDAVPEVAEFAEPIPAEGATLLSLVGAGMHQVVRSIGAGRHYGSTGRYPLVIGVDAVARTESGDLVYTGGPTPPWGTMAERMSTPLAVPLPTGVDPLAIAAGMNPAMSGWMPLTARLEQTGSLGTVLVMGATGMAGGLAVQAARALGARAVIAAGRDSAALERLRADGVEPVSIAHGHEALAEAIATSTPDLVLDYVWGPAAEAAFEALARRGTAEDHADIAYVQIGALGGMHAALPASLLRSRHIQISGSGAGSHSMARLIEQLPRVMTLIAQDALRVPYTPYPLSAVADAWRHQGRDRAVVVPDGEGR